VQRQRPTVHHSYEYDALVYPLGRKTQATEAVGDELQATEANGFTRSEANAGRIVAIGNKGVSR
jgi:hypothetical protein